MAISKRKLRARILSGTTRAERQRIRAEEIKQQEEYWHGRGVTEGRKQAEEEFAKDLHAQTQKANIELARALSSMVESAARAVITFIGEGGLRG